MNLRQINVYTGDSDIMNFFNNSIGRGVVSVEMTQESFDGSFVHIVAKLDGIAVNDFWEYVKKVTNDNAGLKIKLQKVFDNLKEWQLSEVKKEIAYYESMIGALNEQYNAIEAIRYKID